MNKIHGTVWSEAQLSFDIGAGTCKARDKLLSSTARRLATFLVLGVGMASAQAATITVVNTNNTGGGSLRQAVIDSANGDTIVFDATVFATMQNINLLSMVDINKTVTIDATGTKVTVNGVIANPSFTIFNIQSSGIVTMKNFTVANSGLAPWYDGGGIRSSGNLTLSGMTLSNHNYYFSGGGGGLSVSGGTATVVNSTFASNQALSGGAIGNYGGTLNVINSTFSGNLANSSSGKGGAIYNQSGTATLINNTFVNNRAKSSGGGLHTDSGQTMTLVNNLLAANETGASSPYTANNCAGTMTDNGHNLDSGTSCAFSGTGSISSSTSYLVGTLGDYGGLTQTVPLLPGSAAIDAGDATACANVSNVNGLDQRGVSRPQGAVCDIGAFESKGFSLAAVSGSTPQSAAPSAAFTNPLALTVTSLASSPAEPVDGGEVTYTPGSASGATATLSAGVAIISSGAATVNATANATSGGPYNVAASARGVATGVNFALTNASSTANGACGSASSSTLLTSAPSGGALCSTGTLLNTVATNAGTYTWLCQGTNGGSNSNQCSAPRGFTVTSSAGANGSISPSGAQVVAYNATPSFTLTPANSGYGVLAVGGTCGGTRSGNSFTASAVTADCSVAASFAASASAPSIPTQASGVTATLGVVGCTAVDTNVSRFVPAPTGAPANTAFPFGLLDFKLNGCTSSATVTVTYSAPLPSGTATFYKQQGSGAYTPFAATIDRNTNSVTFTLVDGGAGDDDGQVNGSIHDPSGLGFSSNAASIPTLSEWGLIALTGLMGLFGLRQMRRRGSNSL